MEPEESNSDRKLEESDESPLPDVEVRGDEVSKYRISIEPILLAIFLADTLSDPVTVNFVLSRTCAVHFHYSKSICSNLGNLSVNHSNTDATIQPYAAVILTGMNFLSQFLPALTSLFVGPWSDYNGRKLVLVIPALGYALKYTLLFAICFFPNLGPEYFFVAVIPVALSGGMVNLISAAFVYVSDISHENEQSFRMSVAESAMYLGGIVGVFSSSYIYNAGGAYGFELVYGLCASVVILVTIPTHVFLPESVRVTERGKGLFHVFELKLLKDMCKVCFKKREGCRRTVIFLAIASMTIAIACGTGESNVTFLYMKLRFRWDLREFTLWAFVTLLSGFLGVVFGSVLLFKWLKVPDAVAGFISFFLKTASAFYMAFIPSDSPQLMFYSGLLSLFGGLCSAIGRTLLTKSVPREDLGKVFALTAASEALVPLGVAPLYTVLYNATIKTLPNAFLLLTGSMYALCCLFYIVIYIILRRRHIVDYERMENEGESESQTGNRERFFVAISPRYLVTATKL